MNKWEFPIIQRTQTIPHFMIGYRKKIRRAGVPVPTSGRIGATHFFLDDFRFESIWNDPKGSTKYLTTPIVLSPDFSLYRDWPLALQIWNTYRNRWCGAFWQSQGYVVIPTISWSGPESYDFCFEGVQPGGVVAVSALGVSGMAANHIFMAGLAEMRHRIRPSHILCYGNPPESLADVMVTYPTFWQKKQRSELWADVAHLA